MSQSASSSAMLDAEVCGRALASRDPRFDGIFFVGISTTMISPAGRSASAWIRHYAVPHGADGESEQVGREQPRAGGLAPQLVTAISPATLSPGDRRGLRGLQRTGRSFRSYPAVGTGAVVRHQTFVRLAGLISTVNLSDNGGETS